MQDLKWWPGLLFVGSFLLIGYSLAGCGHGESVTADAAPGTPDAAPSTPDARPADAAIPDDSLYVFKDDYGDNVTYAPFGGSVGAPTVDSTQHHSGNSSLRIDVPASGYVGGTMTIATGVDLSHYDAVTFYAKASKASASLNVAGLGNDAGDSFYSVELNAIPLTSDWTQVIIPIPLASRLTSERGLFHVAEGAEDATAYTIWIDDVKYQKLLDGTLGTKTASIATESLSKLVGDTHALNGASLAEIVNGSNEVLAIGRSYFDFTSSMPEVASVDAHGVVSALAPGMTTITAKLGDADALGALTLTVLPVSVPTTAAPTPTPLAADVISLYSNAYTNVPVDSFRTSWSNATLTDEQIAGNDVKKYTALVFAGIEFFATAPVDATMMTNFHIDLWSPDASVFRVKLVDFGANGAFGGGDDVEAELAFDSMSTPALMTNNWVSLDLPLASFTTLTTRAHLSQLIISSSNSTVYIDNIYFHK